MRANVSSKGQVVLPAEVRRQLRLVKGEQLSVCELAVAHGARLATLDPRIKHPAAVVIA
jgi:AbrB family looped-hinge helix DNA binding protein